MKKAYPTYKETEIPWPKEIPFDWELAKISSVFLERKETVSDKNFRPLSVTMKGIVPQLSTAAKTDNGDNRKKVVEGDFVINSRSDRKGSAGVSPLTGSVSVINTILKPFPEKILGAYCDYLLTNYYFKEEFYRHGKGIVDDLWSTKYSNMKGMNIPLPSLPEQRQIAAYLDHKCPLIDTFIAKKKRLIELLKEQKQAIINQAVTRGIDPDVRLKPSGVDWLGDIPAHWKRAKLKYYIDILPGFAFSSSEYSVDDNDIKLLRGVNINPDQIKWIENVYWPKEKTFGLQRFFLQEGDIVFGMDRPWIKSGMRVARVSKADLPSLLLQRVARLKTKDGLLQDYLFSVLKSQAFLDYFSPQLTGVSVPHISTGQIGEFVLGIPTKDEQKEILKYFTTEQLRIELTIEKITKEIDLIQEYKTTLIAAAVIGKIDVRDWQADEAETTATLNELNHATKN